jgi:hypothetical protein
MAEIWSKRFWSLFRGSLVVLPYASYLGMVGIGTVLLYLLGRFRRLALEPLVGRSLLAITVLLTLSTATAYDRGEALLQLSNFLPYFVLFGVLPFLFYTVQRLEQVALSLVVATIPMTVISVFEYLVKAPWWPREVRRIPWVRWIRSAPHKGRAMVMFDHPNAFASYLVLILGLALGLILKDVLTRHQQRQGGSELGDTPPRYSPWQVRLLYSATFLLLLGIFCSGSRNGLLIAVTQLAVFGLLVKVNRTVRLTVIFSLLAVIGVAAVLGIGGRSLTVAEFANDPRVRVWQIALELIGDRPWLGWGLGNYKFLYPSFPHDPEYFPIFHPHNLWLMLSAEAGIPVMLLFTALVGYLCYRAVRSLVEPRGTAMERAILTGYLFSFWGSVAFSLFDVTLYDARVNTLNWILLSGIHVLPGLLDKSNLSRNASSPIPHATMDPHP